jgi:hypothetical protein
MTTKIDIDTLAQVLQTLLASPQAVATPPAPVPAPVPVRVEVLEAFTFKGVDVPELDAGEDRLDLTASAVERSPYNKVLFRAGREHFRPGVTVRALAEVHREFAALAAAGEGAPKERPAKERTHVWVTADGREVACTEAQHAAWSARKAKPQAEAATFTASPQIDVQAVLAALPEDVRAVVQAALAQ